MTLTESIVEDAALARFGELGYVVGHGPADGSGQTGGGTAGHEADDADFADEEDGVAEG